MKCNLFCCALVIMWGAAFAPEAIAQAAYSLPGDGVADPMGKTGFFPNTIGGIDALDLATGKLLWTSDVGNRPLLATDNRVFVQKGAIVHLLDTAEKGKVVFKTPLPFPGWVSVDVAYGRRYRSSARMEGKSLLLSWEAHAFYAGGARPPPDLEKRERKEASGVARIDLETGKLEALDAEKIAAGKFLPIQAATVNPKAGVLTLVVKDGSAKNPKAPDQKRRVLQAVNTAKEVVWEREVAAPVYLPLRP